MGFFKESTGDATSKAVARMHTWCWVLIYGGLLLLVLGEFTRRNSEPTGWMLIAVGAIATVVGAILIWVRSRMPEKS